MRNWFKILKIQLKRVGRTFPGILLLAFVLTVGLAVLLQVIFLLDASDEKKQLVRVGIVGELSDTYLGMGITVLTNMESIKSMVDMRPMEEDDAVKQLETGELNAYIIIPDGFIQSLVTGENHRITYVTTRRYQGIGVALTDELLSEISGMLAITQNTIYGMQYFMMDHGQYDTIHQATEEINLRFIDALLNRTDIYEMRISGVQNRISIKGYYLCSILIIFLLFWGINCAPHYAKQDQSLDKLLFSKGYGATAQVTSEWIAYFVLMVLSAFCLGIAFDRIQDIMGLEIMEWELFKLSGRFVFFLKIFPVIAMLSAFQIFLYELVSGIVNGVLLQFLCAISFSYLSGCLYPISFFPEFVQKIFACLPVGAAMQYTQKCLTMQNAWIEGVGLIGYLFLFIGLKTSIRKHALR